MAFQQLKQYLSRPPIMSNPVVDEVLFAYIAIAFYAISFVLIWVDSGIQSPVYYVSKSLNEAEVHYLPLEKGYIGGGACYKKTSPLFPSTHRGCSHPTSIKLILWSADYTGRVAKWATILGAFDTKYMPRTSIKGQVLADLVAESVECPEEMNVEKHGMDEK